MPLPRKSVPQAAALPFVCDDDRVRVLLITSRRRGRWILPKGWAAGDSSMAQAAAREAEEEAGVVGLVDETAIGSYGYTKRMRAGYDIRCDVFVYPLLVIQHLVTWREQHDRRLQWASLTEAAGRVDDHELGEVIGRLAREHGEPLRRVTETLLARAGPVAGAAATPPIPS
jgi:8-oxo-dGTP pyrophosphatase MutT (NUDIX family)